MDIRVVASKIGAATKDLGTLCRHPNINKYSKVRPGYWKIDENQNIVFQKPRGITVTDERGYRPETDDNKEYYILQDFLGYDNGQDAPTFAVKPFWADNEVDISFSPSELDSKDMFNNFIFNEVDWFNEATLYREKNAVGQGITHIHIIENNNIVKSYPLSSVPPQSDGIRRMDTNIDITRPGSNTTRTFYIALGTENLIKAIFSDIPLKYNVTLASYSNVVVLFSDAAITAYNSANNTDFFTISLGMQKTLAETDTSVKYSPTPITGIGQDVQNLTGDVHLQGYVKKDGVKVDGTDFNITYQYFPALGMYQTGSEFNLGGEAEGGHNYIIYITSIV